MNLSLAAKGSLHWVDRSAVRDLAAMAAAFADVFVDHDPSRWRLDCAALAATTKLSRTRLIIDQHGYTFDVAQFALYGVEFVAVFDANVRCESSAAWVLVDIVGDHDYLGDSFGCERLCQLGDRKCACSVLAAGHGDRAVVQNFVGHRRASRDGLANGQRTRVGKRAITQVLETMGLIQEGRHANPLHTFAAHVGDAEVFAFHAKRHAVATNAAAGHRAVGRHGRPVVRATGTKICRTIG